LTLNTGLRRGTLFGLKMSDIDWQKRTILIRPSNNKSRKVFSVHLNETAYRHLLAIRTDREKVFPWPHCSRCFHTTFHRLQNASGIAQEEHFGLHALRRTLATMLYEQSPGAAQIALGHSDQRTTQAHYVAPNAMVARALDALPQPEAFKGRLDGAA
jgi:integrase